LIEITDEEARIGHQYYRQVTLPDFLLALRDRFRDAGGKPRNYALPPVTREDSKPNPETEFLTYTRFFDELSAFLKPEVADNAVLILGESTSLYVLGNLFGLPRNGFISQAAWGSLGHETGCAIGVAHGSGKRPLVVAGDGGFMMICQEMSTLVQEKCNGVVFVMSNRAYAIEQAFVDINAFKPDGKFAAFDVLPSWDYLSLAKAFGAKGYRVEKVGDLRQVLREIAPFKDIPALVEVVIPMKDLPPQLKRLATPT
jgi:indolepyruvate decarboxylase